MSRNLRNFIVATDFSPNAEGALRWVIPIAKAHGARITLVHAIDAAATDQVALELQAKVEERLAELEQVVESAGVEVESEHHFGRPWEVIVAAAEVALAELVIVGTRGQTAHKRLILGSTADRVLRTCCVPVLTIHPNDVERSPHIRTIVVATDFSDGATEAASAATLVLCDDPAASRIVLVHVLEPIVMYEEYGITTAPISTAQDREETRIALESIAERLRGWGVTVETVVRDGYPVSAIEDEARTLSADLVAIGTHGRSGLQRLMLGSVAEGIVHHAPCPVLSVRRAPDRDRG